MWDSFMVSGIRVYTNCIGFRSGALSKFLSGLCVSFRFDDWPIQSVFTLALGCRFWRLGFRVWV